MPRKILLQSNNLKLSLKTVTRTFLILLHFAVPYLLVIFIIILHLLINGEGSQSTIVYKKYKNWWIGSYILTGLIHVVLLFMGLRVRPVIKILICFFLALLYMNFLHEF
jgi:hypothetical protein